MSTMDLESIFHDRRDRQPEPRPEPEPEPETRAVAQGPEVEVVPERMSEEALIDSLRFPSAHPGEGTMVVPRKRDKDLCRHCMEPILAHGAGHEHHVPEPMPNGQRTPGISADVEDGRARSTQPSGIRPTHRRGID